VQTRERQVTASSKTTNLSRTIPLGVSGVFAGYARTPLTPCGLAVATNCKFAVSTTARPIAGPRGAQICARPSKFEPHHRGVWRGSSGAPAVENRFQRAKSCATICGESSVFTNWLIHAGCRQLVRELKVGVQTRGGVSVSVSDFSTLGIWVCARRSIAPRRASVQRRGRPISDKPLVICNEAFENKKLSPWNMKLRPG
jgi:hypothetical protein